MWVAGVVANVDEEGREVVDWEMGMKASWRKAGWTELESVRF